ncbi:cystatin domain protein [Oesophagostomum dentatum]|uniref:Cystatin domain protein n=1 Tax=Oesophagostomum dentatum TaxID=61180 RepID=A0A0B1RVC2_OESDE|nr:cystatin domain protein [Oesophagostomum dentatum]
MQHFFIVALLSSIAISVRGQFIAGGYTEQDPTDPEFMLKALKATESINENVAWNNTPYLLVPIQVVSAKTQVIAGMKTVLEVLFGESGCVKGSGATPAMVATYCKPKDGGSRALFTITVIERSWEDYEQYSVSFVRNVDANERF